MLFYPYFYYIKTNHVIHVLLYTCIESSNEDDRVAIVTFSSDCKVIFSLNKMNTTGKEEALKSLEGLYPSGGTNIWAGLQAGLDILYNSKNNNLNRNAAVLLLTDGMSSSDPPNGHIGALKGYCESLGGKYPGIISTCMYHR
jgi:Mg-chelatase subunit ChlD